MKTKVELVEGSIGPNGIPLLTYLCTYPRIIHAEMMTHKMLNKNASSNRAIPGMKQLENTQANTFTPSVFQKLHKGMQGSEAFEGEELEKVQDWWRRSAINAVISAGEGIELGVTKQLTNRWLETPGYITVVITGTEWANFFGLRCHQDAEIHIQELAYQMKDLYLHAKIGGGLTQLEEGQWHLPFVTAEEKSTLDIEVQKKLSVARCAWTSYKTPEGKIPSLERALKIYDQLYTSQPMHASPFEHQGQALPKFFYNEMEYHESHSELSIGEIPKGVELRVKSNLDMELWSSNFRGWIQFRKTLDHECINNIPEEGIVYP